MEKCLRFKSNPWSISNQYIRYNSLSFFLLPSLSVNYFIFHCNHSLSLSFSLSCSLFVLTAVPLLSYSQPGCIVNLVLSASLLCCMCCGCVCICCDVCDACWWWCWWLWWSVCVWWCCTNLSLFRLFSMNSNSATTSDKIKPPINMKKMPATFFNDNSLRDVSCFSVGSHSVFSNHHLLKSSVNSPLSINDSMAKFMGTLEEKQVKKKKRMNKMGRKTMSQQRVMSTNLKKQKKIEWAFCVEKLINF